MMGNCWSSIIDCFCTQSNDEDGTNIAQIGDNDESGKQLLEHDENSENEGSEEDEKIKLNMKNYISLQAKIRQSNSEAQHGDTEEPLFIDKQFPLGFHPSMEWKRPKEISSHPRLIVDGVESSDVCQGSLGNCWWLASCATVLRSEKHREMIIPSDNLDFNHKDYEGKFHFRFWDFDRWTEVVIDDRLPVYKNDNSFLYYGRSSNAEEFWLPLLEKAFAKFSGSYEATVGGDVKDSLTDLTGGISETFQIKNHVITPEKQRNIVLRLQKSLRNNSFVCAQTNELKDEYVGLVEYHAYTVLDVNEAYLHDGSSLWMVKLRNPYGTPKNYIWIKDFSKNSPKWNEVKSDDKIRVDAATLHNGEWWMTFDDFSHHFPEITICLPAPDFNKDGKVDSTDYYLSTIEGEWKPNDEPGYTIEFEENQAWNDGEETLMIVTLLQTGRRRSRQLDYMYINMAVFSLDEGATSPNDKTSVFSNSRERVARFRLKKYSTPYYFYPIALSNDSLTKNETYTARIYTTKKIVINRLAE